MEIDVAWVHNKVQYKSIAEGKISVHNNTNTVGVTD